MVYDVVIKNGKIINPEKGTQTVGNIGIADGVIKIITRADIDGKTEIDAKLKEVAPGFIDAHAHIDGHLGNGRLLALQGVTTVINGHCGISPFPIKKFIEEQNIKGFIINQVQLIGHTSLREEIGVRNPNISLSSKQIERVNQLLEQELKNGAAGLSFGLEYIPATTKEEMLILSKTVAKYGKVVSIHSRSDGWQGLESLKEMIDITKMTGASVIVSHVIFQYGFGMMKEALTIIDTAVKEGYDISCDSGMYNSFTTYAGSNVLKDGCVERWECTYNDLFAVNGKYAGQRLTRESYEDLRKNYPDDIVIAMIGDEHEIYDAFDLPYMMVSSDAGSNKTENEALGHPEDAGTFPAFFRKLVREQGRLTLVDAVRRCTYLPAKKFGLENKGRMRIGADADIVIFDSQTILDNSKFSVEGKTNAPPDGIDYVLVNGKIVVEGKKVFNISPGEAIPMQCKLWKGENFN